MSPAPVPLPPDDDELVARLRVALRAEADAVAPFSGRIRSISAIHDWAARRRAARRRASAAVAALVAVALVGVGTAALSLHPSGSTSVGVSAPAASQQPFRMRHPAPAPLGASGSSSAAAVPAGEVPVGFDPLSATFVTPAIGYVLGTAPCGARRCLLLASTLDGGSTWSNLGDPAPAGVTLPSLGPLPSVHLGVRFADQEHGWIYGYVGNSPVLWWTTDAGTTWRSLSPAALAGGEVAALESTAGRAEAVVVRAEPPGVQMVTAPKASAAWKPVSAVLPAGHTAAPTPQLVLQRTAGWLLEEDPAYVAGARLDATGTWKSWSPSCATSAFRVMVAAVSTTDVVELCQATSSNGDATVYQSLHAGNAGTWRYLTQTPWGLDPQAFAANRGDSFAVAGRRGNRAEIVLHTPGSWVTPAWSGPGRVTELGFEDPGQGIAVVRTATSSRMLMTFDAGYRWGSVDFQRRQPGR